MDTTKIAAAFIAMMFYCALTFAKGDEKIDVEAANVSRSDVNTALTVTRDHHFNTGDKVVDAAGLKAFLANQRKDRPIQYVLVSGEHMTMGDLLVVAHVGEALGFTVLFESKGEFNTLTIVK